MLMLSILIINIFVSGLCFNLDVDHPIIIENPDISQNKSYFGYSLVLYSDGEYGEKWLKIGAPKATYHYGRNEMNIKRSGIVYHCPYMKKCEMDNRLNYSTKTVDVDGDLTDGWTGGSMDINYRYKTLAISASNWHYFVKNKREWSPRIPGRIFLESFQNRNSFFEKHSPLTDPEIINAISYYARAQVGVSMHLVENKSELLIGAPGVYNYLGTIVRISNIDREKTKWKTSVKRVGGHYHEYSGYAVTSGYFFGKNELYYVTGLPRGLRNDVAIMYGAVHIFTYTHHKTNINDQYKTRQRAELYGTQFGEYFGASLAAGDLNGDQLDDLIVGAPFRKNNEDGYNHGSVYVIYGHKTKKLETTRRNTIEGRVANGLFGLAVMFLGDLDKDGYGEFAVSAPQEESSGAIYIYTYNKPTYKLILFQKIMGKEIHADLKGFGMSFSRPKDIDDNHFSDILVGSPISGHVVLLRSKPTVHVDTSIRVNSTISKSSDTLAFQCCYHFKDFSEPTLTIVRTVIVDDNYLQFRFANKLHWEEKTVVIKRMKVTCEDISVFKISKGNNYLDPINIMLTHRIHENKTANARNPVLISNEQTMGNDTFCKMCPLLSKKSLPTETKLVMWDQLCNGKKCEAELIVHANFVNLSVTNTFVLGSKEFVSLRITVSNKGDPAFLASLEMVLPNGVYLSNDPVKCETIGDVAIVKCNLGDQLKKEISYDFELNVDEGTSENELGILLNSSTTTANRDDQSSTNITLYLKRVADFEITGESKESSYIYSRKEITLLENIFKIDKFGPSPMSEIEVNIRVPYKIRDSKGIFQEFAEIRDKNDDQVPRCHILRDFEEFYPKNDLPTLELPNSDGASFVKNETYSLFNATNIYDINCTMENVKCVHMICSVGPFNNVQKYAEVTVEVKLNFEKLADMLLSKESIRITSEAIIVVENFTQNGNRSDYTEVTNLLIIEKEFKISLWILIGSVVAGLLILICLTGGLAKAGFFERKEQKKLMVLKEEAIEEDMILKAMIDREFSNGYDEEEENDLYGLGFIRKREPIKEGDEENELYGGLLK